MEIPTFKFCPFNTPNMKGCHAPKEFKCPIADDANDPFHLCNMEPEEYECMVEAIQGETIAELEGWWKE